MLYITAYAYLFPLSLPLLASLPSLSLSLSHLDMGESQGEEVKGHADSPGTWPWLNSA